MRILVVGAGGFAKEVTDLVFRTGNEVAGYYIERPWQADVPDELPVYTELPPEAADAAAIAVGDTSLRLHFYEMFAATLPLATLIDPSASVSRRAAIGSGSLIMQNAIVNSDAVVGANVILNVACCVAHDCRVHDHAHIGPGAQLTGGSEVGTGAFCGASSVVLPHTHVGAWSVCGAGSVVTSDVPDHSVVSGVPARRRDAK
jgi:acetyltransferase EpsM